MAAPQVTGSLGLMFSAADEAFMLRYDDDPELMAIFMKDLLLDAVDILPGFDSLVVSGGRLNVNNAIQKLVNPRIGLPFDTLMVNLAPDSTTIDTLMINNLLGIELPYEAVLTGNPGWLNHSDPSGLLPGNGEEEFTFFFDAEGLSFGFYFSEMIFTDFAGMSDTLFIVLEVSDPSMLQEPLSAKVGLHCFPNPFSSSLNIKVQHDNTSDLQLTIYSMEGEVVKEYGIDSSSERNIQLKWNGSDDLPSGIYLVNIKGRGVDMSRRLVKVNH